MSSLYELDSEYLALADPFENCPREELLSKKKEITEKLEGYLKARASLAGDLSVVQAEKKRLADREKNMKKELEKMDKNLLNTLEILGEKKVKTPLFTISLVKSPVSVHVVDEEDIPDEFFTRKETRVLDKKRLKCFLESEETEIEGAFLERKSSIRIK